MYVHVRMLYEVEVQLQVSTICSAICGGSDCFIRLDARFRVVIPQMMRYVVSTAVRVTQYASV